MPLALPGIQKLIVLKVTYLLVLGPSLLFGEPSRAELFDKASRAEPSFFQKRQAEPSFLLSKPSQTELSVFQNWAIFDYFQLTFLKNTTF